LAVRVNEIESLCFFLMTAKIPTNAFANHAASPALRPSLQHSKKINDEQDLNNLSKWSGKKLFDGLRLICYTFIGVDPLG